ncbi:MAG: MATE family efflux transporter [Maritimibacter sp.]
MAQLKAQHMAQVPQNSFTQGSLGKVYVKTAVPIVFVMLMNGLLSVVDAIFLGAYVGPNALAAVTLMFPLFMLIVALSALVSGGMSSLLARALGAEDYDRARAVFAGAHGLAVALGLFLIALFLLLGGPVTLLMTGGDPDLAQMGTIYLRITVFFSPLLFLLSVNSDALRNEGKVGLMALMGVVVSLANIAFNYLLIAVFELGVAGSAYGTAAAQALSIAIILVIRVYGATPLKPAVLLRHSLLGHWPRIVALGAPQSLNFMGISLVSTAIITMIQWVGQNNYADTVTAYGITTRVVTFAFLPLLGISFAMQTITGNNYGAALWSRSDATLRIALRIALVYCACVQLILMTLPGLIASAFVEDPAIIKEAERILPLMTFTFFLTGPLMMIAAYFQAIGAAARAALLGLIKPYGLSIPLTFLLPRFVGEVGIWITGPVAEVLLLGLTLLVLGRAARKDPSLKFGLFHRP